MSANDFYNAWNRSKFEGSQLLIFMGIASYADEHGVAWPQLSTIAKYARCSPRTITRQLPEMVGDELIWLNPSASIYAKAKQYAQSNLYVVLLGRDPEYIQQMQDLHRDVQTHTPIYRGTKLNEETLAKVTRVMNLIANFGSLTQVTQVETQDKNQDTQANLATDSFKDSFKDTYIEELKEEDKKLHLFLCQLIPNKHMLEMATRSLRYSMLDHGCLFITTDGEDPTPNQLYLNAFNTLAGRRTASALFGVDIDSFVLKERITNA